MRRPLLVSGEHIFRLLLGGPLLAQHLKVMAASTIKAVVIPDIDDETAEAISAIDVVEHPTPSQLAKAAAAMRRCGIPLQQIVQLSHWYTRPADASVYASAAAYPSFLQKMDMNKRGQGRLTLGHAHLLVHLPTPLRDALAGDVIAQNLSVAKLALRIEQRSSPVIDVNVSYLQDQLSEVFGSRVSIDWDPSTKRTRIHLPWFSVPELQGIMSKLCAASDSDVPPHTRRRTMVIDLDSEHELQLLTGHLLPQS